ncbi:hypothetical protein JCM18237_07780 [Halorubrum luteum]
MTPDGEESDPVCAEPDCTEAVAVRLSIPWEANRRVCPACARAAVQQDGVVAEPIEGREESWP